MQWTKSRVTMLTLAHTKPCWTGLSETLWQTKQPPLCTTGQTKVWSIPPSKKVYAFIRDGIAHAATFPRSLMPSFAFAHYVLGLKRVEDVLPSGRVKGAVSEFYVKKRKLKQKPPLLVEDAVALDKLVSNACANPVDRLAAGFFLSCAYTRCRYSDCLSIDRLELDFVDGKFEDGFRWPGKRDARTIQAWRRRRGSCLSLDFSRSPSAMSGSGPGCS